MLMIALPGLVIIARCGIIGKLFSNFCGGAVSYTAWMLLLCVRKNRRVKVIVVEIVVVVVVVVIVVVVVVVAVVVVGLFLLELLKLETLITLCMKPFISMTFATRLWAICRYIIRVILFLNWI
jgi:hypothetical protein